MRESITIFALASLLLAGCASRYNRQPKTRMIEAGYFTCFKCGSLSGGIFGKGPTRNYRSDAAARCAHDWRSVAKPEFLRLATERFGIDWSSDIPFFSSSSN
jgi:hypothetical protein